MNQNILKEQKRFLSEKLHGKSILISGVTGLIGSQILMFLSELNDTMAADIRMIGLYRSEKKKKQVLGLLSERSDVVLVANEIEDVVTYGGNVDYIIHCAGISGGSKMHLKNPLKVFDTGIKGTGNLLDFATTHETEGFLFVSTYEIYGNISQEEPFDEAYPCALDPFELRNIYAEIKRLCESMCCAYSAQYVINTYAARLTSTFGNGAAYNDPRFFAEFARCIIEGRDIVLKSKGGTVRSYLDAEDAATAFLYILVSGKNCNAYNVTNMENAISIRDIAFKMIKLSGSNIKLRFDTANDSSKQGFRKGESTLMDAEKIMNLGWKPAYFFEDTLEKLMTSMKDSR